MIRIFFLFVLFTGSLFSQEKPKQPKDKFTIKTYTVEKDWGYDILKNGKVLIHQPNIPAVAGNRGFRSKEDAEKVALLMKKKIEKNIMPPTIEIRELDSLKIKY
jgi:hypothetical protein